jgi:hypothetical protein
MEQVRGAGNQKAEVAEMSKIPTQLALEEDNMQHKLILKELTDIESKVIWELENWKRAEEARFRYNLKNKEIEHMEKMKAEWRAKEIEREKVSWHSESRSSRRRRPSSMDTIKNCSRS